MRIVSQKRDLSIDFDGTVITRNDNCIRVRVGDRDVTIGTYGSTERAKEVFEDIHESYNPFFVSANSKSYYMPEV